MPARRQVDVRVYQPDAMDADVCRGEHALVIDTAPPQRDTGSASATTRVSVQTLGQVSVVRRDKTRSCGQPSDRLIGSTTEPGP